MYGSSEPVGYDAYSSILKGYQDTFEDIVYTPQAWLPGVDTLTLKPDGSVRTYGSCSGTMTASGKSFANSNLPKPSRFITQPFW